MSRIAASQISQRHTPILLPGEAGAGSHHHDSPHVDPVVAERLQMALRVARDGISAAMNTPGLTPQNRHALASWCVTTHNLTGSDRRCRDGGDVTPAGLRDLSRHSQTGVTLIDQLLARHKRGMTFHMRARLGNAARDLAVAMTNLAAPPACD